jgi:hypothetical protein
MRQDEALNLLKMGKNIFLTGKPVQVKYIR